MPPRPPERLPRRAAFTLAELLTVIAILALLATLTISAFPNLLRTGNLGKTGQDIAGLLEQARAYAMAQNTYVWVGFEEAAGDLLLAGAVASRNGDASPASDGLQPLGPLRRFERVKLVAFPETQPHREEDDGVTPLASITTALFTFTAGPPGGSVSFDTHVIRFNSRGECRVEADQLHRVVEIGLQEAVDGQIRNPADYVAIQLGSLSGSIRVIRP